MARAVEITIWKPHASKRTECLKRMNEFKDICLKAGVSSFEILGGSAGKDVGHVVAIQHFKGLADNGAINEALASNEEIAEWWKKYQHDVIADLVSHDLYEEEV